MKDFAFKLYLLFTVSWFLHLTARLPILGVIRFDLILIGLIALLIVTDKSGYESNPIDSTNTSKKLIILFAWIIISIPFAQWPGSVLRTGIPNLIKAVAFYYFTVSLLDSEKKLKTFITVFLVCQSFRIFEPMYLHITTGYWGSSTNMGEGEMMDRLAGAPSDIINGNGLAFVIVTVIPFYHYLCISSSNKLRLLYLTALPIFLYALVLTASRTGFLALIVILAGIFSSLLGLKGTMSYIEMTVFVVISLLVLNGIASFSQGHLRRGRNYLMDRIVPRLQPNPKL